MNRRNFILGLGTAATLSGAASVTGAAVNDSVSPEANFQVVATEQLIVERNDDLGDNPGTNGNYTNVSVSEFDPVNADPYPNMSVNGSENNELGMALATDNTNETDADYNRNSSFGGTTPYNGTEGGVAPIQITNNGNSSQEIAIDYNVGEAVTGASGDTTSEEAANLLAQVFTFSIDGTQISPSPGDTYNSGTLESDNNSTTVGTGTPTEVDFTINYSDSLADELANLASSDNNYGFSGNDTAVDLLDEAVFGTVN